MSIRLSLLVLIVALCACDRSVSRLSPDELPAVSTRVAGDLSVDTGDVDARARDLVIERNWPGLSLAVGWGGEMVWTHAVGFASLDGMRPMTPDTRIRIGPATHAVTAAMLAVVTDDGIIDLDAPIGRYLADLPESHAQLTLRQLLNHAAGVRDHRSEDEFISGARHCADSAARLALFIDDPLVGVSADSKAHSAYGLVLAAAATEAATGSTYGELIQQRVLGPLGMTRTGPAPAAGGQVLGDPGGPGQPKATTDAWLYWPFAATDTRYGVEHASQSDLSCVLPAEGLVSTPMDLVRLGNALLTDELISRPKEQTQDHSVLAELGFRRSQIRVGDRTLSIYSPPDARGKAWLGPGVPGGTAALVVVPAHDLVIAAATNVTFARELAGFVRGLAAQIIERRGSIAFDDQAVK